MKSIICITLTIISITAGCSNYGKKIAHTNPKPQMQWVYIEKAAFEKEVFIGYVSKYETTNAEYAMFLNQALHSGDIEIDGSIVKGAAGEKTNPYFITRSYYQLNGEGLTVDGMKNLGSSKIFFDKGKFKTKKGFENHPVTYVTWFGAAAFCDYYGWQLPTEQQWQAVACFDGTYNYGCGKYINSKIANYKSLKTPHGTTEVGKFGTFGYSIADLAGNVLEFTDSNPHPDIHSYHIIKGGGFNDKADFCKIQAGYGFYPSMIGKYDVGFRVFKTGTDLP